MGTSCWEYEASASEAFDVRAEDHLLCVCRVELLFNGDGGWFCIWLRRVLCGREHLP